LNGVFGADLFVDDPTAWPWRERPDSANLSLMKASVRVSLAGEWVGDFARSETHSSLPISGSSCLIS